MRLGQFWMDGSPVRFWPTASAKLLQARENGSISREDYIDGLRPDIIAKENRDTGHAGPLAVVEISITFNQGDLENAARRAAIISGVMGNSVTAFVATHGGWPDEVNDVAESLGVTVIRHEDPDYDSGHEVYDFLSGRTQTEGTDGQP